MKNKFFLLIVSCLLLSGCGKKTLTCSLTKNIESGKSKEKQVFVFNNNKISSIETTLSVLLDDGFKDYSSVMVKKIRKDFKIYNNHKGISAEVSENDSTIKASVKADYSKMNSSSKRVIGFDEKMSYDDIKSKMKKDNYTCK